MKKGFLFFMSIFSFTACQPFIDMVIESEAEISEGLPIEEDANELPIISDEHYLNERTTLESAIKQQQKLYKLNFTSDFFINIKTDIVYYPLDATFGYSAMYKVPNTQTSFKFEAGTSFDPSHYKAIVNQLHKPKQINHDKLPLVYGKYRDDQNEDYYIVSHDDKTTYVLQIGSEEEGYSEDIILRMGTSLRTETDGVYESFYDNLTINMDKIKFPNMNEQRVAMHDVNLTVNGIDETSHILITYLLSEQDTISYHIDSTASTMDDAYSEVDTVTMSDGTKVTEYTLDDNEGVTLYQWHDDACTYTMTITLENPAIINANDIQNIIESALHDRRSFDDVTIFQALSEQETETNQDKALTEMLENMNTTTD